MKIPVDPPALEGGEMSNVIPLPQREPDQVKSMLDIVRTATTSCIYHSLRLDETTHNATCGRCGQVFGAFEALLYLARDWRIFDVNRNALRNDVKRLEDQRDALRQELANLRAQRRRLEGTPKTPRA